ncbi:hypothetical protein [Aciditerrimonas ferrireducens]|uniref:hypothetical protein n=1 Tax=Aciditerrimonas ferrireducens TaxID=667306 RepID=UPI0020051BE8|nr:hypothetical protein [Aciditerrimonas ferrireducens]MCK4177794.1 hypothetical protein [Aciditerrimonas ferrireducens]
MNFGYIDNNGGSSTQSITITNNSSQTVELTGVGSIIFPYESSDSETGIYCTNAPSGSDTVQLAPGQSCTADVTLTFGDGQSVQDCYPADNTTCEYYYAPSFFVAPASNPNDSTGFYVPVEFVVGPPSGGPGIPTTPGPPSQQGGGSSTTPPPPSGPIQPATGCHQLPAGTVVAALATPDGGGYWIVDSAGQVSNCGDASPVFGQLSSPPPSPIVAAAESPGGLGYWMVSADGAVYAFGDAQYWGGANTLPTPLAAPIVGIGADQATGGYWLVGADGGVFSFHAQFEGSTWSDGITGLSGPHPLAAPIVGIDGSPDGQGYLLVGADGGVFTFGDAQFHGSVPGVLPPGTHLAKPVVGIVADPATGGYWMVASDGGVFSFHEQFYGSAA